jgi:flagellar biosynthesis protein FlhG
MQSSHCIEKEEVQPQPDTKVWAVGGGKGGIGKSVISVLLAFWLVRMGYRTVLVDADLGGANLHTLMGIKNPPFTLNDFITKKYKSLEDICIKTDLDNFCLISGACEILSLSNLKYVQKMKIIQDIFKLNADYILLDLGSGTSFNTLDFFLTAHKKITVLTPQPTSIQNAYGFVRNAVYRRLAQLSRQRPNLQSIIHSAMDPNNELKVRNLKELFQIIQESEGEEVMMSLQEEIEKIKPFLITNMTKNEKDENAGRIISIVAEKYLMIHPVDIGSVAYDKQIDVMISKMMSLTKLDKSSQAFACIYDITSKLL